MMWGKRKAQVPIQLTVAVAGTFHALTRHEQRDELAAARFKAGWGIKAAYAEADVFLAEGDRRRAEKEEAQDA